MTKEPYDRLVEALAVTCVVVAVFVLWLTLGFMLNIIFTEPKW